MGLSAAGVERLHEVSEAAATRDGVPGLVVLVAHGDEVHLDGIGRLALGGRAISRDTLFRISSTSKPITAAATLALVEEGLITLEEPIDRLLPELSARRVLTRMDGPLNQTTESWRPVTARDLLTFTFGFGMNMRMFTADPPWPIVTASEELRLDTIGPPHPGVKPDSDSWIANLGQLPLIAQPGERWLYNTGATVLSVLLERAAGIPFDDVLRTRIFEPLGMRDTSFWTTDTDRLATSYRPSAEGPVIWDPPDGDWSRRPAFCDGAAGLLSTADDLLAFSRMLLARGGSVLTPESVLAMTSDQLNEDQKSHGGLGRRFFDGRSWGYCVAVHDGGAYGWDGGFGTTWLVDPVNELVVIVLTQLMFATSAPPQIHVDIQSAAFAAAGVRR